MKQTLLTIVQDILLSLDADEVSSIDDTLEATQVANIVKNTYLNMASTRNWSGQKRLIQFDHSGTTDRPTHLKSPENLKELHSFRYNCSNDFKIEYREIKYREPDDFLRINAYRSQPDDNTRIIEDLGGTPLVILTNRPPIYWTSFDDTYIVCDAYDKEVDDALQASKTQLHVTQFPNFTILDDFVPDLPVEAFQALYNEAKSIAFVEVKQVANQKAEQESRRQQTWLSRKEWQLKGGVKYSNFGRRSQK